MPHYPAIADKLISLRDADLALRDRLMRSGKLQEGYAEDMEVLHLKHAAMLEQVIDEIGYPTISKVGEEGSAAAWLIIQHAISNPSFMRKCQQLLAEAVDQGEASALDLAYLSDRIAVLSGQQQLYGTQFDWDDEGKLSPNAYDDIALVNERRASLCLPTLEEQTQSIRLRTQSENHQAPTNLQQRNLEMNAWRKKVGWLD
ncbi:DUF6624 domain-containing protein [Belliella kenyensis]|uniref:DUF6624 domain-containing protein n=1 Tax=Belliella kenyensis TaxID=1472724 RepID=A0ABV8EN64_9BACT|nr:DUF6624 domain-containing protein [Belliella kenyensis]MCH7402099.1 hypothetical protein [Belliella kenyensis]MDN3601541.1 hypothetical protein [Belliella kenyensis]